MERHIVPQILVGVVPDVFGVALHLGRIPVRQDLFMVGNQLLFFLAEERGSTAVVDVGIVT